MRLYRTCAPRTASIEHFLDEPEEIQAIQSIMPSIEMIDEVFSRGPSVDSSSRFCPVNFSPVPLYASEDSKTTFFEYCFHILKNRNFLSGSRPINAVLYSLLLTGKPRIKDISKREPPGVMSKTSYKAAHKFVKGLKSFPDIIKYRSVRDIDGNKNYAIYFKQFITEDGIAPQKIIINPKNKKSVEVTIDNTTYEIGPNF